MLFRSGYKPERFTVEVGAVTDNTPMGVSLHGPWTVNLIVTDEVFDAILPLIHPDSQRFAERPLHYFKAANSAELVSKLEELNTLQPRGVFDVWDTSGSQQEMRNTRTVIAIFLYGFLTLITLIGVTNIFNTISTNVALRRREFAMLKSVGLTPNGFNKMINYESIFYGLKALLYGLPVGIAISVLLYNSFGNLFTFTFFIPTRAIAYCIIGVFLIDALKTENL